MHDYRVLEIIVETVAKASGCTTKELYLLGRYPARCRTRETALFLIRQKTKLSLPEIGARFFGRHHTTILSAIRNEEKHLQRQLPLRPDGRTLKQWHDFLLQQIDAAIAAEIESAQLAHEGVIHYA